MRALRQIVTITSSLLVRLVRDGSSFGWLVVLPLLIIFVLGVTVQGLFSTDFTPAHPYRVAVSEGSSDAQHQLTNVMRSLEEFFDIIPASESEARRLVLDQEVDAAVIVPNGFPVEPPVVIAEPGMAVGEILEEFIRADRWRVAALDTDVQVNHIEVASGTKTDSNDSPWLGLSAFEYYSAGLSIMFVMHAVHRAMIFTVGDRESGAYARVRSFGVSRGTYLIGGFVSAVAMGMAFIALMTGLTRLLFGVVWGDLLGWLALTAVTAMAMAALSFLLASITTKSNTLEQLGSTVFTILAMAGGSSIPLHVLPHWLTSALAWLPSRTSLEGYFRLLSDASLGNVATELAALGVTTLVLFVLGWLITGARARGEV